MVYFDNMYPLLGWFLRIAEISSGHYTVLLTDESKRRVELSCADAELPVTVQECINWAEKIKADDQVRNDASANE